MKIKIFCVCVLAVLLTFALPVTVLANTPNLSLSQSGNTVNLMVSNADPNASVILKYMNPGQTLTNTLTFGYWTTNYSGNFSTSVDLSAAGVQTGASLAVSVNGQDSNWQVYNIGGGYYSGSNFSLGQTNVSLNSGQSQMIPIYNSYASVYISNNTNSSVVSASVSGNNLTLYGYSSGTSTVTLCQTGSNFCQSVYVNVSGNTYQTGYITANPSYATISSGQSQSVYLSTNSGYSGGFYLSNNTNSQVATGSISGSTLTVYGNSSGSTALTICNSFANSSCATVSVSVTGGSYYGTGLYFSPSGAVSLNVGNSSTFNIYTSAGTSSGSYYVSSTSTYGIVNTNISGNQLTVTAQQAGSTTLTICSTYNSACGTLSVTVNGYATGGSSYIGFSNTSPSLSVGQTNMVSIYSGSNSYQSYYVQANTNSNAIQATINGSSVQLYGKASGSGVVTICYYNPYTCANLNVTVTGLGSVASSTTSEYPNGMLLKNDGKYYITYKNTKSAFKNLVVFLGLGYRLSNVSSEYFSSLTDSGFAVNAVRGAHPWGSWVSRGKAVYFVHENGLIPVPSWDIFLDNNGVADWIVKGNAWDWRLPVLTNMDYNDSRLR